MKILICDEAFIGDLILATSVLRPLKMALNACQIGFLTCSWSQELIQDHLLIDWIHIHDQAKINRASIPKKQKKEQEKRTRTIALKEVTDIQYDMAIDLHSYFATNSAYFLYKAQITDRIGYWDCRQPFFYTQRVFWDCQYIHALENHRMMLLHLGIEKKYLEDFKPCLIYRNPIPQYHLPERYFCIHANAGWPSKEWKVSYWEKLAQQLEIFGYPLVFIGKGKKDKDRIHDILRFLKNSINLCDKLTLKEVLSVIQNAKFFIGMDSMAGHLAAYFGIPSVLIYPGETALFDWRPYHPYCHVIKPDPKYWYASNELYPKRPIDMISPDEVFEKAQKILKAHSIISA